MPERSGGSEATQLEQHPAQQDAAQQCTAQQHPAQDAEALFRAYAKFIASFLARMGVPAAELDDLVQEVFVVAHQKGGYQSGPAHPRSWLTAIALRVAHSGRRARMRHAHSGWEILEQTSTGAADPAETLEQRRAICRVQRALDRLALEHRAAFLLYELEGESCENIAAMWGVPLGTVYSRLHHARRRFSEFYQTQTDAPRTARPDHAEHAERSELAELTHYDHASSG